jgi:WD40 repeat protein
MRWASSYMNCSPATCRSRGHRSPRRLQPAIPRDLETICLKCLEKHPAKRYESAAALADDLARWSDGQPIHARPIGQAERAARWARRNPAVAMLSVAVLLVALAGAFGVGWEWNEALASAAKAESAAHDARASARNERWERYRVDVMSASSSLRLHDVNAARRSLDDAPPEHRDWVWSLLRNQLDRSQYVMGRSGPPAHAILFNRTATAAVVRHPDGTRTMWNLAKRREHGPYTDLDAARSLVLSDDGATLAFGDRNHAVVLREVATGRVRVVLKGHTDLVDDLVFSKDGRVLVSTSSDRSVRFWNLETGELIRSLQLPKELQHPISVSPDLRHVIATEKERLHRRVFNLRTGEELPQLAMHDLPILFTQFAPEGGRLATIEPFPSNTARIWELSTGRLLATLRGHKNTLTEVAFSPNGDRVVTASHDRTVRLWEITPGAERGDAEPLHVLEGHSGWVNSASFSPDGRRILSASHDGTLRFWNARTGKSLAVLHGHAAATRTCKFRPDGVSVFSASEDGEIRVWNIDEFEHEFALHGHETFVYGAAFHPDGERVFSASWDGTARLWNATSGRSLRSFDHGKDNYVASVACRPDGKMLATYARDDSVRLWDVETGALLHRWEIPTNHFNDSRVVFSSDGKLLASGSHDGRIRLLDVDTRAEHTMLEKHLTAVCDVAFSPDGRWLASAGSHGDRSVRIWDVATKQLVHVLPGHDSAVGAVAWNRDGTRLASGSHDDGLVLLWDTADWTRIGAMKQGAKVYSLAFTPNGKLLAAACSDNLIRFWNLDSKRIVAELSGHADYVHQIAFSPDGTRLVSASGDRTLRIWDTVPRAERERRVADPK